MPPSIDNPFQRLRSKTTQEAVRRMKNSSIPRSLDDFIEGAYAHADHAEFWHDFAEEIEDHAEKLEHHSKKAHKLAEVVRTVMFTKKVAGRTVPNSTRYTQTITKQSDQPFKK